MDTQQQPAQNNTLLIIAAAVIVVGVGIGLGYKFLNTGGKNAAQNPPAATQNPPAPQASTQPATPPPSGAPAATETPPPPPSIGFYGKVIKRDGTAVTIQQLLPPTTPGGKLTEGKIYTVTAEETISYINQKKNTKAKPGEPPFAPSPGSLAGLTKGLFVYIETSDDIASKTAVKANQMMYSVESPF